MKKANFFPFVLLVLGSLSCLGAAPSQSGYSDVPERKGGLHSEDEPTTIRDPKVTPEEAYKNGVQEFAIIASDTGFFPSRIIVRRNIPVHISLTSASSGPLCFVIDEYSIKKGVPPQKIEEVRFMPTKAGPVKFYCPKQELQGTIVVRD